MIAKISGVVLAMASVASAVGTNWTCDGVSKTLKLDNCLVAAPMINILNFQDWTQCNGGSMNGDPCGSTNLNDCAIWDCSNGLMTGLTLSDSQYSQYLANVDPEWLSAMIADFVSGVGDTSANSVQTANLDLSAGADLDYTGLCQQACTGKCTFAAAALPTEFQNDPNYVDSNGKWTLGFDKCDALSATPAPVGTPAPVATPAPVDAPVETSSPSVSPTGAPVTPAPTGSPTPKPTRSPTKEGETFSPSASPTDMPSESPTPSPTPLNTDGGQQPGSPGAGSVLSTSICLSLAVFFAALRV